VNNEIDLLYYELTEKVREAVKTNEFEGIDFLIYREKLTELLKTHVDRTKRSAMIRSIKKFSKEGGLEKILDYGSGGGQTVIFLRLLGYDAYGVCLSVNEVPNAVAKGLGLGENIFYKYDGVKVPFQDSEFSFVYSEQVLEHVMDLETYYRESARVLKPGGRAYFSFPQRLIPFDTHTRVWFVHYFPKKVRDFLYKILGQDTDYVNEILNFKSMRDHRSESLKFFSKFLNKTSERLREQAGESLDSYEGNIGLRSKINIVLQLPLLGKFAARVLSLFSNADIILIR